MPELELNPHSPLASATLAAFKFQRNIVIISGGSGMERTEERQLASMGAPPRELLHQDGRKWPN